jgi:hypothetical protein
MIDLVDKPVTIKDYDIFNVDDLPKILLGYRVKNKLDEIRLNIKDKYNPRYISHFKWGNELEPVFFYGIQINPKAKFNNMLQHVNNSKLMMPSSQNGFLHRYQSLLSKYDLTCSECYNYLSDGVYPVDLHHLDALSRKSYIKDINKGFNTLLKKTDAPWYLNLPNFNIFILTCSMGYNIDYNRH